MSPGFIVERRRAKPGNGCRRTGHRSRKRKVDGRRAPAWFGWAGRREPAACRGIANPRVRAQWRCDGRL